MVTCQKTPKKKNFMFQEHFANDAEAFYEVKRGRAWGALVFQQNYSESLVERTEAGRYAEDWVLEASNVEVKLDMSSKFRKSPLLSYHCTTENRSTTSSTTSSTSIPLRYDSLVLH